MDSVERLDRLMVAINGLRKSTSLEDRALRAALLIEREELDAGRRPSEFCERAAVQWLNTVSNPSRLVAEVDQDPLHTFERRPRLTDVGIAEAILRARDEQVDGQLHDFEALRALGGDNDALVNDLLYTGCRRQSAAAPNVGVLLPVRLETRFYAPDGASGWRLRVLIVPDEPWIDRHDPVASAMERDSVERLWREAPNGLDSDKGRIAWRMFVDRHGGPRAAWLARTFPPLPPEGQGAIGIARPTDEPSEPRFSQISGFPNELELWIGRGGQAPVRMARWPVQTDQLQLDFWNPENPDDARWWSSWTRATYVGLGIEVDLGANRPDDIDVLYVVGLGIGDPAALFSAHRDSGALAVMEPGTPTNTVDGQPAADLGQNPETWLQMALQPHSAGANRCAISRALTGNKDAIGAVPGDTFDYGRDRLLVTALWPVLWGHASEDIWGLRDPVNLIEIVERAGLWAGGNVAPEGPLPAIRITDQPYGLLPVTSLRRWQANGRDAESDEVEGRLQQWLVKALGIWVEAASAAGNVVGADTNRLLELVGRTSSSNRFAYRWFAPLELLQLLYWTYDGGLSWPEVRNWWRTTSKQVLDEFPVNPHRMYGTLGWPQDLRIALVAPPDVPGDTRFRDYLAREQFDAELLVTAPIKSWFEAGPPSGQLPESLLTRLLLHSVFVTASEVHRAANSINIPALEPVAADSALLTKLAEWAGAMTGRDFRPNEEATRIYESVRVVIRILLDQPVEALDRAMRATLDAAAYRIDPWITAFASRRLYGQTAETHRYQLGVFGWVDAPRPGTPGPTAGGLLHAPSPQQATTAVILRDKALHDAQPGRWDMDLESNTIRLADQLAEEVRLGVHIREVLGRQIERIVGIKAIIEQLRNDFPIRGEHAGRRVCDGEKILREDPARLPPLTTAQQAALERLRRALDTYGDLLVAEAVHHVVAGRGAVAGAAMEAAAGLAGPPNLEVITTRPLGRGVNTNVIVALPLPSEPDPPVAFDTSPGNLAEPAAAAFLSHVIGQPDAAPWRWDLFTPDGTVRVVHLSELKFVPIDTVMLSEEELGRLVLGFAPPGSVLDTAWPVIWPDGTIHVVRLSDLGLSPSDIVVRSEKELTALLLAAQPAGSRLESPHPAEGAAAQRQARRIVDILGNQPAIPSDLLDQERTLPDDSVRKDLHQRYENLRAVAELLIARLQTGGTVGDDALRLAARWGVTPVIQGNETVVDRVARAGAALQARLETAPADVTNLGAKQLATAIAELAAPEGQIAVLSRINLKNWPTTFAPAPTLDEEWLTLNASVRSPLARLEAHQLDATLGVGTALVAWTNRLGDPWQVKVPKNPNGIVPPTRLVAIYGPKDVLPSDTATDRFVAFGLLDSWGEVIPAVEQGTTAAFEFNAPTARAPQAILLAVSPVENEPLTASILVDIVAQTRELARARMATPKDLQAFDAALPLMMLPASGITIVELEPRHSNDRLDLKRDRNAVSV